MAIGSLLPRRTRRSRPLQRVEQPTTGDPSTGADEERANHRPASVAELRAVRLLLTQLGLPAELVLPIIDEAEYYPVVRGRYAGPQPVTLSAMGGCKKRGGSCAAQLCVLTPSIPGDAPSESWKAKRVTWTILGHDQGWGGEFPGTFRGAYSWYEACIIRPAPSEGSSTDSSPSDAQDRDRDVLRTFLRRKYCAPPDIQSDLQEAGYALVPVPGTHPVSYTWFVQRNRAAQGDFAQYCIQWTAGGHMDPTDAEDAGHGTGVGFIESLRPGDRIGLWIRAQYPGWANLMRSASVDVLYDVY
ncbi:hypothetical protein C8Q73DRAFT_786310 [Cubamyces lactineus]|nr:hypothetical protein C8Q73DRAFT_786310 [Cubamyces lactineus]